MSRFTLALLSLNFLSAVCCAEKTTDSLTLSIEVPQLNISEYHRPYIAVWIQDKNKKTVANLAVWYQLRKTGEGAGTKWLPDLRQWWRRSGRTMEMPVDGISAATRPPGKHEIAIPLNDPRLTKLQPGKYTLVVEAAREVGGRELVELPFQWPAASASELRNEGEVELGAITLSMNASK